MPALITALADPDVNVRHAAAASLGQIGDLTGGDAPGGCPAGPSPGSPYPDVHTLGEIAEVRARPRRSSSSLATSFFRGPALEALGGLADRDALPRLVEHLHDPEPVLRNAAIRAVVAIEERATAAGESLDPEVQAVLRREDLVTHLLEMLRDQATPRTSARR